MNMGGSDRLWGYWHAFDHPVAVWLILVIAGAFVAGLIVIGVLDLTGRIAAPLRRELWLRIGSWAFLAPAICLPILAGAFWTMLALAAISLLCYREYARATGLFREKLVSGFTALGIILMYLAALDHWYALFLALIPLVVIALAIVSIPLDRPAGYIQRTGLAVFGFLLFGGALAHLAYATNDPNYRPILLLLLVSVSLNDVLAFVVGKTLGGPKLLPHTSPNKTVSGSLGSLIITIGVVAVIAEPIFVGTRLEPLTHRLGLGLLVGALGQLGDLMLSSIKRDIGIKDMGITIPGHGGVLDRFNSLLLVAPATFHYIGYFKGFGLDQPTRIFTGG
jgi:phosphatidate cytidylyltransferase